MSKDEVTDWAAYAEGNRGNAVRRAVGWSEEQIVDEILKGGRLVKYQTAKSFLLFSERNITPVCLVKANESKVIVGLPYFFSSLLLGWWGLPWGPIFTLQALFRNIIGGFDQTESMIVKVGGKYRLSLH
jgi:hypothetical protein